jgi:hypothetical protein
LTVAQSATPEARTRSALSVEPKSVWEIGSASASSASRPIVPPAIVNQNDVRSTRSRPASSVASK